MNFCIALILFAFYKTYRNTFISRIFNKAWGNFDLELFLMKNIYVLSLYNKLSDLKYIQLFKFFLLVTFII